MSTILRTLSLASALFVATASAATFYHTPLGLTGDQEVAPPVRITDGTGFGTAVLSNTMLLLTVHLEWQDLTGPPGAAHIHCCSGPGANSTVAIDFVPFAFPNTPSGVFDFVFDLDSAASYGGGFLKGFGGDVDAARAAVITGLNAGKAYFNIHTDLYGAGEIRGDIVVIPEPSSMILLGLGLAALTFRRRFC